MAYVDEDEAEIVRGDIAAPEDTVSTWGKKDLLLFTKHKGVTSPDPNDKDLIINNVSGGGFGKIDRRVSPDSFSVPSPMIHETQGLEGRVKMVACSTNKTLILLGNGKLFSWGEWSEDEGDDPKWLSKSKSNAELPRWTPPLTRASSASRARTPTPSRGAGSNSLRSL